VPTRRDPDEGPQESDLERFGEDSPVADARCTDCGTPVWSEADVCPKCYAYLGGDAPRGRPGPFAGKWRTLVVVVLIAATLTLAGIPIIQAFLAR
jgi:hypothetical protein